MALGSGISVMGKSSDLDANQVGSDQAMANQLLMRALQQPQQPDRSWTQGAARMAEALVGAYKSSQAQKKQEVYNLQRQQNMAGLASALASGDPKAMAAAIANIRDPNSQLIGMNAMIADQAARRQQNNALQTKGVEHIFGQEDRRDTHNYGLQTKKYEGDIGSSQSNQNAQQEIIKEAAKNSGEMQRDVNKIKTESAAKLDENGKARVQNRMADLNSTINNADLNAAIKTTDTSPEAQQKKIKAQGILDLAKKELDSLVPLNAQLSHPNASSNTLSNSSYMGGNGIAGANPGAAGSGGGKTPGAPDLQAQGALAADNLATVKEAQEDLNSGKLTNANMSEGGQVMNHVLAILGQNNNTAAMSNFKQTANKAALNAIQQLQASGGTGRLPKALVDILKGTTISEDENAEQAAPKLFLQQQAYNRMKNDADLQQQWINKNGGINMPDKTTGKTFEQVQNTFFDQNPIVTLRDFQKTTAEKLARENNEKQASSNTGGEAPQKQVAPNMSPPPPQTQQMAPQQQPQNVAPISYQNTPQNQNDSMVYGNVAIPPKQVEGVQNVNYDPSQSILAPTPQPQSQAPAQNDLLAAMLAKKQQEQNQFPIPTDNNDFMNFYNGGSY